MFGLCHSRGIERFPRRRVVVSLAILALTVSLSTRTFHAFAPEDPSVQSHQSHAMRQYLAADAIEIAPPILRFADLLLPVVAAPVPPAEPDVRSIEFSESLYNRPPPASYLFLL